MIDELSKLLRAILNYPSVPEPLRSSDKEFVRPVDPYPPNTGRNTVNLFLYDIRENLELRSNERVIERQNDIAIIHQPPLRASCCYLVTAWPQGGTNEDIALREQLLLAQILQALSRFPTIPASRLVGTPLEGQSPLLPMVTAHGDPQKSTAEFWTALGNKLRASISVDVTISLPVLDDITGPIVTTIESDYQANPDPARDSFVQVGGQVLRAPGQGVANALVDIVDAGLRTTSD